MSWSLERLIKGGDVTGECDAGTPGSDGASPYPENLPNIPYLRAIRGQDTTLNKQAICVLRAGRAR
jgi:hypothetical protein